MKFRVKIKKLNEIKHELIRRGSELDLKAALVIKEHVTYVRSRKRKTNP